VRITRSLEEVYCVEPDRLVETAEGELYVALRESEALDRQPGSVDDFLNAFLPLIPYINRFFDDVLVMVEDESLRNNRLGLLQRIVALADGVADMSHLEGF
jgi:glycyl-tRNA synthetase